ncbi:hypothetical protein JR316_0005966 [Psilocybe cubensis]|uniref:Uncharacterized protein n=2 Tax=Psilocybe cubensis TaxID=181762 RepID=A0ACB8H127_PSICU|nr:hypothetical protein JR316_0005966 [Psilocybe cubensis]KAH9481440.1 hypothetical protein JR316_0005966 [Psilocybe cubensis]
MSTALTSTTQDTQYPQEILYAICAQLYASCLLPDEPSLDPLIHVEGDLGVPTAHPSSVPPGYWPEPVVRRTLANLCLVNHAWYQAAKPWLWHKLEVRLPRTWLSLVEEIAWNYDEETVDSVMGKTIQAATQAAIDSAHVISNHEQAFRFDENLFNNLDAPDVSISLDLLSPVPSRDPSPRRLRPKSKSPARWKILRSISNAIQDVMNTRAPGVYVPTPEDPRPGRFVRHLDFNHFRTIGMRRSVEEGVNSRFVTGDRVQAVLKEMPNLTAFGATEYMDGALTLPVLNELFLRGAPSGGRGRPTRGRALVELHDIEEEDRERRRECKDIEAVDLTGCVSAVFVNAFTDFVNMHLLPPPSDSDSEGDEGENGARRIRQRNLYEPLVFPGLRRLGLRGVKSILPQFLGPFVLAFPHLTHLDLSGTRVTPEILDSLGQSSTLRLKSLALARCIKLTSECITSFLVDSAVTSELTELNLYGDMSYGSPIVADDLLKIVTFAPSFVNGNLVYLDLSSTPMTKEILLKFKPQLKLRSLGLSHILHLELKAVAEFLKTKAPNVEILTVVNTSPELDCGLRLPTADARSATRQSSIALHTQLIRPLCTPPSSFSIMQSSSSALPPPTRLRVVELSTAMLGALGAGAGSWRIIRSKGGRGWYVDTASAWVAEKGSGAGSVLCRDLPPSHLFRIEMEKLSDANGNVSSGVGWHARKMEILHGHGMLGREDGLYGAVSFAYQG